MEIRYSREMNHNYMIIEAPEEETGYAVQMLSANAIEGLLKFRGPPDGGGERILL